MKIRRILAYHRVMQGKSPLCVSPDMFLWQMQYLKKKNISVGTLSEYLAKDVDVCLTFDDGWEDNFKNALPIIKRFGFNLTIFLTLRQIGAKNYLDWDIIRQMVKEKVEIGSHTISHPKLTRIPVDDAKKEIFQSRSILEENLKIPVKYFCYPSGDYNKTIAGLVQQAGYQAAVITPLVRMRESEFSMHRVGIYGHNGRLVFKIKLFGIYR